MKPRCSRRRLIELSLLAALILGAGLPAAAQGPPVGTIEVFGLRKVPKEKVLKALGTSEGGRLPRSKADTEIQIEAIDGVVRANLEAVCCEEGKAVLYVGIEERGAPHFDFLTPPDEDMQVPEEIEKEWLEFVASIAAAARRGEVGEDLTRGHSLMADPDARRVQERFLELAAKHHNTLVKVLRRSEDGQQRAMAAFVLGYSNKKKEAAEELQRAIRDPDPTVRSNAMRALDAMIVLAERDPEQQIRIGVAWFAEMLNSVYFTDRSRAAMALVKLTEKRDPAKLSYLRERSLKALIEMAAWKSLGHALPAFILLGRIAGLSEESIQLLWKDGKYNELLAELKQKGRR